ncbi:MAG TPA: twin-arginine translocase TatA/TatE family subunit [Anaeromyxobacteraceae bacterium]|nr:twin-arginine translocase TatA/TatE family subunit [Anaeromyxobacteraceae bacterium]
MFGLGMGEILIILVLALILLGPQKLPDAAKQLGKGLREFRKATDDLKAQFENELYSSDSTGSKPSAKPSLVEAPPEAGTPASAAGAAEGAEAPAASADNVPGLEAALAEPRRLVAAPSESTNKSS